MRTRRALLLVRDLKMAATSCKVRGFASEPLFIPSRAQQREHLDAQIDNFVQLVQDGNAASAPLRAAAIARVRSVVCDSLRDSHGEGATVVPFGSCASGLMLHSSDLDLVAFHDDVSSEQRRASLRKAHRLLVKRGLVCKHSDVVPLLHRRIRVPLIKFTERESGLLVDLTLNETDGVQNTCALSAQLQVEATRRSHPHADHL
jgi:DNA polymerase sigma